MCASRDGNEVIVRQLLNVLLNSNADARSDEIIDATDNKGVREEKLSVVHTFLS